MIDRGSLNQKTAAQNACPRVLKCGTHKISSIPIGFVIRRSLLRQQQQTRLEVENLLILQTFHKSQSAVKNSCSESVTNLIQRGYLIQRESITFFLCYSSAFVTGQTYRSQNRVNQIQVLKVSIYFETYSMSRKTWRNYLPSHPPRTPSCNSQDSPSTDSQNCSHSPHSRLVDCSP